MLNVDAVWQEYGMDQLEAGMRSLFPEAGVSLEELLTRVVSGDVAGALSDFLWGNLAGLSESMAGMKHLFVWLAALGVISALLVHFAEIFDKHQTADLSFYFVYLLLSAVLLKSFVQTAGNAWQLMEKIILFIKLLVPTYLLAVGVATGSATVGAYHQIVLVLIYGVESILMGVALPMIYSHVMLSVLNGIWSEEKLGLLVELLKKAVGWLLKAIVGAVTGISLFQALVSPIVDSVQSTALKKAIASIPGAGGAVEGVLEIVLGSAVMIKNSVGVVLLILLLGLCALPLCKLFVTALLIKCAAALMGIVSDKRIASCANHAGDAGMLLFQTAGTAMILFFICLSIAAAATNRGM